MAQHPPAARRAIIRRLKQGEHPAGLLGEAFAITDGGHAAAALMAVACDDRLPAKKAAQAVRDATDRLGELDRPGRMAEGWGDVLRTAAGLQRGPEVDHAVERLHERAGDALAAMPDGEWTTDAALAAIPHLHGRPLKTVVRRALQNPGGGLPVAKAALAADPGLRDWIAAESPPEVAGRLGGSDAVEAAWKIADVAGRRDALRVLAGKMDAVHELMALGGSGKGRDPADRVAAWTIVGARLDRLGHDPTAAFGHAASALSDVVGPDAKKAHRKLTQAMERSGLDAPAAPESEAPVEGKWVAPVVPSARHTLALVDGYSGGLGAPHLRAVARAAPLCTAFDLDLALVGFPTEDAAGLIDLVDAETNVGEGEGYARQLLESGRLSLVPLTNGLPESWPGTPVATTPHPEDGKAVVLEDVAGPLCLLVGQGKQGLPTKILHSVDHHHELTGRGISMETATAMGILADRLGRLPL